MTSFKIEDITTVKGGKRLPKGHELTSFKTQHPYIRARDIKNGKINFNDPKYINEDTFQRISRYIVSQDDVIITIVGANIGDVAYVLPMFHNANLTENAVKISVDKNFVHSKYLYYYLNQKDMKHYFQLVASGAAQGKLGLYKIKKTPVNLPPLPAQKKIAKILSNYDDLIENNLKRIKLLEESAKLTYEEWFLRFRIDGKKLEIDLETGLPFGWDLQNIYDLYEIKYGQNLPQTKIKESGPYEVYGASGIIGYHSQKNVSKKVALITSRGNGSGDIHRTYDESFVTNNSFIVRSKNKYLGLNFTLHHLETVGLINYCSGSAQPQLTNDAMKNIKIKLPNKELLIKFNNFAEPLIEASDNLRSQNQLLKEARDILLPRLMTGMIDTDNMDIAI